MPLTRRALLVGLTGTPFATTSIVAVDGVCLGDQLHYHLARCRALEAQLHEIAEQANANCQNSAPETRRSNIETARARLGYHDIWQLWSELVGNTEVLIARILCEPTQSLDALRMKIEALMALHDLDLQTEGKTYRALADIRADLNRL